MLAPAAGLKYPITVIESSTKNNKSNSRSYNFNNINKNNKSNSRSYNFNNNINKKKTTTTTTTTKTATTTTTTTTATTTKTTTTNNSNNDNNNNNIAMPLGWRWLVHHRLMMSRVSSQKPSLRERFRT